MFRPMRRVKQQLSEDEALEVLKNAKRFLWLLELNSAEAKRNLCGLVWASVQAWGLWRKHVVR